MDDSADSLGYISLATENLGLRTHKLSPAVVGEDKDTREVGQEGEGSYAAGTAGLLGAGGWGGG